MTRDTLENKLSDLFGHLVNTNVLKQKDQDGTQLTVCNMSYTVTRHDSPSRHDTPSRRIRQTAVVLSAESFELPQFVLSPEGPLHGLLSKLTGFSDIDFEDSPEFSKSYFLHGWSEKPVRVLFTPKLRKWFATRLGWGVHGKGNMIAIYRAGKTFRPTEIDEFVKDCMRILKLFRDGEHELDERPEISRQASSKDVFETATRMGGLIGNAIKRQMQSLSLTSDELETFIGESTPRTIPPGMKRQVLGDNAPLVFIGALFATIGLVAGILLLTLMEGNKRLIGLPIMIFLPLIGGLMSGLTLRYRRRKSRLLREGLLTEGVIDSVKMTSVIVNGRMRSDVKITYSVDGRACHSQYNVYSPATEQARTFAASGETVRVLYDPVLPQHIICLDLLRLFD